MGLAERVEDGAGREEKQVLGVWRGFAGVWRRICLSGNHLRKPPPGGGAREKGSHPVGCAAPHPSCVEGDGSAGREGGEYDKGSNVARVHLMVLAVGGGKAALCTGDAEGVCRREAAMRPLALCVHAS